MRFGVARDLITPPFRMFMGGYGDDLAYVPEDKRLAEGGYEPAGAVVEFRLKGPFRKGINA
jgi:hypothetical protein